MGTAVRRSFSKMPDEDLAAIAAYMKTVPAVAGRGPVTSAATDTPVHEIEPMLDSIAAYTDTADMSGARLYQAACATCHAADGAGSDDAMHPSLRANTTVRLQDPGNLVMTIANGAELKLADSHAFMPAFGTEMSDENIAKVSTYVRQNFGSAALAPVSAEQVGAIRKGEVAPNWLIAHAAMLANAGILIALLIIAAIVAWVIARRRAA